MSDLRNFTGSSANGVADESMVNNPMAFENHTNPNVGNEPGLGDFHVPHDDEPNGRGKIVGAAIVALAVIGIAGYSYATWPASQPAPRNVVADSALPQPAAAVKAASAMPTPAPAADAGAAPASAPVPSAPVQQQAAAVSPPQPEATKPAPVVKTARAEKVRRTARVSEPASNGAPITVNKAADPASIASIAQPNLSTPAGTTTASDAPAQAAQQQAAQAPAQTPDQAPALQQPAPDQATTTTVAPVQPVPATPAPQPVTPDASAPQPAPAQ